MSRYRQVHCCIWNDDKFPFLSDPEQLVFFHVLTTPYGTPFGLFKAGLGALADEKRWDQKAYAKAFRQLLSKGMLKYDEKHLVILVPHFLRYNPPASPNVVLSWERTFRELPDTFLKLEWYQALESVVEGYGKGFREAFLKAFAKGMPIQEQEQEQEHKTVCPTPSPGDGPAPPVSEVFLTIPLNRSGAEHPVTEAELSEYRTLFPSVDVEAELRKLKAWNMANPTKRKTRGGIKNHIAKWLGKAQDSGPRRSQAETYGPQYREVTID